MSDRELARTAIEFFSQPRANLRHPVVAEQLEAIMKSIDTRRGELHALAWIERFGR